MALAKIVFASMTGNTEEIADIVADKLRDLGLDVDVDECTTVDASDFLNGKIYGVVGSGDTFYDEFCKAVDDFDRVFVSTGAEKGSECVKVDLSAEEEDIERLEQFAEELAAKVG